ncbi:MAG: hypothetical protein GX766_07095 [Firmicutes bacterium]|jgi:uncharacterized membrane protein YeaQ/YmgE (transglycosylase-associated protein family)|nr:hypothetical protein [Bacillota bacterium]HOB21739.1 YIEGIA family protein [Bacillota bacterium]HQD39279.1 YIEGIA family protein [Bacillota bacterium]
MRELAAILAGTLAGSIARLIMLRSDYRQYPSFPHGYVIHMSLGVIAAFIGAVALPALLARRYDAATFLAIAAQQFREIRNMERRSLEAMEETELVRRGSAYIEGISRVFEARNYLAMTVALAASSISLLPFSHSVHLGMAVGLAAAFLMNKFIYWRSVGDLAVVRPAKINFDGPTMEVEGIVISNVGGEKTRELLKKRALAVIIEPKDDNASATLANIGQRQAIAHDAAAVLGVTKDVGDPEFTPLVRRNIETGRVALVITAVEPDMESLLAAVRRVPIIENVVRKPLDTKAGRKASD